MTRSILILFAALLVVSPVVAATWHVNASGTGDAPTIRAAVDSSVAGDSILVAPGIYGITRYIRLKSDMVLVSEDGPYVTRLMETAPLGDPALGGVRCDENCVVDGFWFEDFSYGGLGAVSIAYRNVQVRNCMFTGNYNGILVGVGPAYIDNCTFYGNGYGIYIDQSPGIYLSYSILWDHIHGAKDAVYPDGVAYMDFADYGFNGPFVMFEDPEFCGPTVGDFYLQSDSPCAPGNHPWDESDMRVVGAFPVGCLTVNTEEKSWGEIKAMYREVE